MRRFFILLVASILSSLSILADTVIPMEYANGVYKVPCTINGARMKMIFDTGASNVSLSLSMAQYLYENDYIVDADFGEMGKSQTADGRIVDHITVNLRDFEIGGLHIENVKAIVTANQEAPLLMGQSVIQRLGKVTIDGDKLIILSQNDELNDDEIEQLDAIANQAIKNRDYNKARRAYETLYQNDALTNYGIYQYGFVCRMEKDFKQALKLYKSLENTEYAKAETYKNLPSMQFNLFIDISNCYSNLGDESYASIYLEKGIALVPSSMIVNGKPWNTCRLKASMYESYAASCNEKERYSDAADYYWKALEQEAKFYKISVQTVWNICLGKIQNNKVLHDESIKHQSYKYAENKWLAYILSDAEFHAIVVKMAKLGNEFAKIFCNENGLSY